MIVKRGWSSLHVSGAISESLPLALAFSFKPSRRLSSFRSLWPRQTVPWLWGTAASSTSETQSQETREHSAYNYRKCRGNQYRVKTETETRPRRSICPNSRDRDETETFNLRDRDETEMRPRRWTFETKTRPRRWTFETETRPRWDRDVQPSRPRRGRNDPINVSRPSRGRDVQDQKYILVTRNMHKNALEHVISRRKHSKTLWEGA